MVRSLPRLSGAQLTRIEVLGVRHHGPGSARSVAGALAELCPDAVVIEGPPELDALVPLAGDPGLVPPVAGLVYAVGTPRKASFYPMAAFSPEWVALRWAVEAGVPVRFADLAATHFLADGEPEADGDQPAFELESEPEKPRPTHRDPITRLAQTAGYDDPERWWEDAIEHRSDSGLEQFALLREAMAAVRADDAAGSDLRSDLGSDLGTDVENDRREAAMRRVLREVVKAGAERVAVVCGAYHAPALDPEAWPTQTADNRLLTGLPRTKVTATWTPWTAKRLAASSGYGAGVTSPGWYQHLFRTWADSTPDDVVPGWLARVARELRAEGLDAAPASVVEAVRLAEGLAAVRGRPSAGLAEVTDATQAVLCEGSELPLRLVERRLVVGEELGSVPDSAPLVPLAADLARIQRSLRLKPSPIETTVTLDLRKETQLARSRLLHRLELLGVDWGEQADAGRSTGTFKEAWRLEWRPELAVAVVEAGMYGTTVLEAAENRLVERAATADLAELGRLVELALLADLPRGLSGVVDALAERTAQQHDTLSLLQAIEPLARTQRYGDVRRADTRRVKRVLDTVVVRAAVGLRTACASLDDDAAGRMRMAVDGAQRGVTLVGAESERWQEALGGVAADDRVHGLVAGRVNRLLLDAGRIPAEEAARRLSRHLSVGASPAAGAAWLDGFLEGEAVLLLHDRTLLGVIDEWVSSIDDTTFSDLLPLLRRTFSRFQPPERNQIGERLRHGVPVVAADDAGLDLEAARPAVRRTAELLGLEVTL